MFGINNENKKPKYLGAKAMNRKKLATQNLIFILVAVIIIIILCFVVVSNLSFLVKQINLSLRVGNRLSEEQSFDLKGLEVIKNKLPFVSTITPTPTPTEMLGSTATSTLEMATTTPTALPGNLPMEELL
ncbi:MAG TPA: hypothetical protein PLQ44_03015 [Candidatus Paceibacterota bacterium]|nr:hypothetical protein [Candidatus Paceibacterota bacterium]